MAVGRCLECGGFENTQVKLRGTKGSPDDPAVKEALSQKRAEEAEARKPRPTDPDGNFTYTDTRPKEQQDVEEKITSKPAKPATRKPKRRTVKPRGNPSSDADADAAAGTEGTGDD